MQVAEAGRTDGVHQVNRSLGRLDEVPWMRFDSHGDAFPIQSRQKSLYGSQERRAGFGRFVRIAG